MEARRARERREIRSLGAYRRMVWPKSCACVSLPRSSRATGLTGPSTSYSRISAAEPLGGRPTRDRTDYRTVINDLLTGQHD
jgi:hypothetical protein